MKILLHAERQLRGVAGAQRWAAFAHMKSLAFTVTLLFLLGCASQQRIVTTDHDDIAEAVFRHMCQPEPVEEDVSHNVNQIHKVYFFAFGDSADPTPEFMSRFSDFKVPVKPLSAGVWREMFVYDRVSGERGAAFYIEKVTMLGRDKAEVEAVLHPGGGLSASGPVYRISRRSGKWIVTGEKLKWIS